MSMASPVSVFSVLPPNKGLSWFSKTDDLLQQTKDILPLRNIHIRSHHRYKSVPVASRKMKSLSNTGIFI